MARKSTRRTTKTRNGKTRTSKTTARKTKKSTARKTKKTTPRKTKKTTTAKPAPAGRGTVTPYVTVTDATEAITFYKEAFGAKQRDVSRMPDGHVMHAELRIGDSAVFLSDEFPMAATRSPRSLAGTTFMFHVHSQNVDHLWEQATRAGAEVVMPLDNQFWEERYGQLRDPFGHVWALSQPIKMSRQEIEKKRREAERMMAGGPPSTGNGGQERELFV
jgi:uncharacterized glyoxalase superfamily protein PhnB